MDELLRRRQMMSGGNVPPPNQIWYTTTDEQIITPSGFTILSNTYRGGIGKIVTSGKITSIPDSAWRNQATLSSVQYVWENITTIGTDAFNNCLSLSQDFNLPSLTDIERQAFYNSAITSFFAPRLATVISTSTPYPHGVFQDCTQLRYVSLENCTSIGNSAFKGCVSLSSVNIPSVTTIGTEAFRDCSAMQILSLGNTIPSLSTRVFTSTPLQHIYVPADMVEEYKADSAWSAYASIISAYPNV